MSRTELEDKISGIIETYFSEFIPIRFYGKHMKIKNGEIGKIYGRSIIIK